MNIFVHQRGVGLVEVLVAVLLLSIAVLGFSALQMRAISATDESLVRTKSLTIVRNLAEIMRAYPDALDAVPTIQAVVSSTATETVTIDGIAITRDSCLSTEVVVVDGKNTAKQPCTINQLAAREALMIKKMAADEDIKVTVVTCPGTSIQAIQQQMCVITAWNDTKALLDNGDALACANTDGVYKTGSHCLISEAY